MKRLLAVLVVSLLAASCRAKGEKLFTYATTGEVTSLDPVFPYDGDSQGLLFNVYETLIAFEGASNERLIPKLSLQVPSRENGLISKDGRTYRFPIRKDVTFHDGKVLTPEDVRYSLLRFMLVDRDGGPSSLLLEPILGLSSTRKDGKLVVDFAEAAKAVAVRGDEVVVTLKRPFAPFLAIMARWSYVMNRAWAKEKGDWDGTAAGWEKFNNPKAEDTKFFAEGNGTGPFMVERWDRSGRRVILKRHDGYWRGPAKFERVVQTAIPEFATRKLLLQGGDADIIAVPRPFLTQLEGMKGVVILDGLPRLLSDPALFFTMSINAQGNPDLGSGKLDGDGIPPDFFADKEVRRAFAHSFDYDAFIKDVFRGKAKRAVSAVPPGIPGFDGRVPSYSHDLKEAEAILRKVRGGAVWEKGFRFTLTYNTGGDVRLAACQILKKNVEALNPKFRIDLRGVDWAAFLDRAQRGVMPMWARGWTADFPDAHNFVFPFYHRDGRYAKVQGFKDAQLDAWIDQAVGETDPAKRAALYSKIARRAYDEVPSILTAHPPGVYAMRDDVQGFYDNAVLMGVDFYPLHR
ncbi:MAG: ABC transporter substrate-binding protein [Elusimicrobia bacterium]|nr:ABC transporter substrate-binding protein [Elusimicrobiota bacterium]